MTNQFTITNEAMTKWPRRAPVSSFPHSSLIIASSFVISHSSFQAILAPLPLLAIAAILFAAAIGFLAAELLVPSHGILALFCIMFAVLGVVAAYMASPILGILSGITMLGVAPFAFYAAVRIYPNTPMGKRVMLRQPKTAPGGLNGDAEKLAALIGKTGTTLTPLRPVGACDIEGRRIECVSESTVIEPGTPIEVTRVLGVRVIVRPRPT